ncbi:hypothetical protein ANN_23605 [Periplaneta americana]|uniref:Uncharacterized protein n=1 Tax=Periplaneta americana TaxID=6978 RepID=A0ABQ8SMW3_PERAM|nr:hypothetical protein ANN_23605 [Periplaneta americana]
MGTVDKLTDCIGYKYPRRRHPAHTILPRLFQRLREGENVVRNYNSISTIFAYNFRLSHFRTMVPDLKLIHTLRWAGHLAVWANPDFDMGRASSSIGECRNAYRVLVGRPEGKRSFGRPRRRWEDNIKMDLREMGYDDRDWITLAQDRDQRRAYVRAAMNLRFLKILFKRPTTFTTLHHSCSSVNIGKVAKAASRWRSATKRAARSKHRTPFPFPHIAVKVYALLCQQHQCSEEISAGFLRYWRKRKIGGLYRDAVFLGKSNDITQNPETRNLLLLSSRAVVLGRG